MLPGPHFEERQQLPTGLQKKRKLCFVFTLLKGICISVSVSEANGKQGPGICLLFLSHSTLSIHFG